LYTGHSDGKINKWDLSKVYLSLSKSLPVATFDLEYEMKLIEKTIEKQSKENADDFNRRDERETSEKDNKTDRRSKSKKSFLKKKKVDNSLGNGVTALVVIAKIQVLAAGYLNGKIVLWDILQMKIRKTYDNLKTV
jgi:WD40 repeat protein